MSVTSHSKACVILGNAPSAREVKAEQISGLYRITVNAGLHLFDEMGLSCDLLHLQDPRFIDEKLPFLLDHIQLVRTLSVADHIRLPEEIYRLARNNDLRIVRYKLIGNIGFSRNINVGFFSGYSAAYGALQIAVGMGFDTINVAGVDLSYDKANNRTYPSATGLDRDMHVLARQIRAFRDGLRACADNKVSVGILAGGALFRDLSSEMRRPLGDTP